jgi:hypothetical protein
MRFPGYWLSRDRDPERGHNEGGSRVSDMAFLALLLGGFALLVLTLRGLQRL